MIQLFTLGPGGVPLGVAVPAGTGGGAPVPPWAWQSQQPAFRQVASMLVALNRMLQANVPTNRAAASLIPVARQAVEAYRLGALPQSAQLAQAALARLSALVGTGAEAPSPGSTG